MTNATPIKVDDGGPAFPGLNRLDRPIVDDCGDTLGVVRGDGVVQSIRDANARLIADAPAMKLALDAVAAGVARVEGGEFCFNGLRYSVHDGDWSGSFTAFGLWDKLPAAIAKAKGGVA